MLLASDGRQAFSERAIARAADLSGGAPVAVVTLAKIYGTRFGVPHPGLLPTKQELAERQEWVATAIRALRKRGVAADGQVAATRKPARKLADVARVRGAGTIVIDANPATGLRRRIEGDVGNELSRRLRSEGVDVVVV
ncbi:MAG: universal stress protein [Gaiellales bacterium]